MVLRKQVGVAEMESQVQVENLDHLGLVAGIVDELGLVELIDELVPRHKLNCLSSGQVVKAMILNCLGFLSAPLYLFSEFFTSKPVSHLLGEGAEARHLNDDRLGRVLDELHELGTTAVFLKAAVQGVKRFKVKTNQMHLDSTSFSLEGEYKVQEDREEEDEEEGVNKKSVNTETIGLKSREDGEEKEEGMKAIEITRGYSRDHRPDLKQFMMNLVCSRDGGIPLWLKVANGNTTDSREFSGILNEFSQQWDLQGMFVVDAAFYSEPNLKHVSSLKWISRVPQTLKEAQELVGSSTDERQECLCTMEDYRLWECRSSYGGIEQRWILVESLSRKADSATVEKELQRQDSRVKREIKKLSSQVFACYPDACEALLRFKEMHLKDHQLLSAKIETVFAKRQPGQPKEGKKSPEMLGYRVMATLERKIEGETQHQRQYSRFILATNEMDGEAWSAQKILEEYKEQQKVERGFRFLKDPLFFTSSVFVKKPERVEALALIMALTLLVYSLAERKLRLALVEQQATVLDQKRRPTRNPTFRWILQTFQGIHLLVINGISQITNLSLERLKVIQSLGPPVAKYYSLTDTLSTCGM
jgi:transposase